MTRWKPDTKERLEHAAMVLFKENGFDETTVADIANRADVTERTFFRYFTDKREVLFGGRTALEDAFTVTIAASRATTALHMVTEALIAVSAFMEYRREFALERQHIIMSHPELQERELLKMSHLSDITSTALQKRGIQRIEANLVADTAITIFKNAFIEWLEVDDTRSFSEHVQNLLAQFTSITNN